MLAENLAKGASPYSGWHSAAKPQYSSALRHQQSKVMVCLKRYLQIYTAILPTKPLWRSLTSKSLLKKIQKFTQNSDFAKLKEGQLRLNVAPFEFVNFLECTVLSYAVHYNEKNLDFGYRIKKDCPVTIFSDEHRLHQAIDHVIG